MKTAHQQLLYSFKGFQSKKTIQEKQKYLLIYYCKLVFYLPLPFHKDYSLFQSKRKDLFPSPEQNSPQS